MSKRLAALCIAISLVFISMAAFAEETFHDREISERFIVQIDVSSLLKDTVRVSPDGAHVAYEAQAGSKLVVVVDGKEGTRYDGIGKGTLIFSPDSKHLGYRAGLNNKQLVVVDGKEGPQYDRIVNAGGGKIVFTSFGSLHYLAIKGSVIYLVEEKIRS